jgi:hypothetical protein
MIPFTSDARSLLSKLWNAITQPEDDSASAPAPLATECFDEPIHDPERILEQEAIYLAILNGTASF